MPPHCDGLVVGQSTLPHRRLPAAPLVGLYCPYWHWHLKRANKWTWITVNTKQGFNSFLQRGVCFQGLRALCPALVWLQRSNFPASTPPYRSARPHSISGEEVEERTQAIKPLVTRLLRHRFCRRSI